MHHSFCFANAPKTPNEFSLSTLYCIYRTFICSTELLLSLRVLKSRNTLHADVARGYLGGRNLRLATQRIHLGLQLVFELTVCDTKQFEMYLNLKRHTTKRCQTDVSVSWIEIPNHTF
jgi:hypothetical protein